MNAQTPFVPVPADKLLETLGSSRMVAEAVAEADAKVAARRTIAARDMAKLEKRVAADWPTLTGAIDDAVANVRAAEIALAEARGEVGRAAAARSAVSFAFSRDHDVLEAELRETADPRIAAFIRECVQELAYPVQPTIYEQADRNAITGKRVSRTESNVASIVARLAALRAAMSAAEDLQLCPDQSSVPEELARLRATLPSIA